MAKVAQMTTIEDYAKYFLALGSRSIRRIAAKVDAATVDAAVREALMKELTQSVKWQEMAVVSSWPLNDDFSDDADSGEQTIEIDLGTYSNGKPVFTVVDWMDGYATIVHRPDGLQPESDTGALAKEVCPCCGGMPETASGRDDDGERDERDSAT
jgi:hypothetical protein